MGDPKFSRAKYSGPSHPWQAERIKEEKDLVKKYGLKNKKELWKAQSAIKRFRQNARNLQARLRSAESQAEKERDEFLTKLTRMGFFVENPTLNDVLVLEVEAILNRRLQTVVHLKGLAYTTKQARQMIGHGHIMLSGRKITIPGYHLNMGEDEVIEYKVSSPFTDELHPMRPKPEMEREIEKAEAATEAVAEPAAPPAEEKPSEKKAPKEGPEKKEPAKEKEAPKDLKVAPGGEG